MKNAPTQHKNPVKPEHDCSVFVIPCFKQNGQKTFFDFDFKED
jgi:hypothetical protein